MSSGQWTIDTLAHAIPVAELRQDFLREAHLATLDDLPAVFAKWADVVARHEAVRPALNDLLEYAKTHHGELPAEYRETPDSRNAWQQWEQTMRQHQGHTAA
ncbi:hypothetical protein [Streptomyces sp. NRRL B-1347]|uniref:hypothetical protein n=1 Tax=Streptomyces sp. NRRL B-1347 TaxID=1476877 RepID=UPI00055D9FB7|nr:hypothetical protein [Streptomyces sp. NRRL B-1347]